MPVVCNIFGILVGSETHPFGSMPLVRSTTSAGCNAAEATWVNNDVCCNVIHCSVEPDAVTRDECSARYQSSLWEESE